MLRALLISSLLAFAPAALTAQQAASDPVLAAAKGAGDASDGALALALYTQAAEEGKSQAYVQLARLNLEGTDGLVPDYAAGLDWAQKGADAGESQGYLYLGKIWMEGLGVETDLDKALSCFQQAEAAGDRKAARYLGLIALEQGKAEAAAQWFGEGAEAGDITSQYYLGRAYERGEGVAQDFAAAMTWYETSAKRGDIIASEGMVGMARLYERGAGVQVDLDKAITLYTQASELGNTDAQAALDRLQG